MAKTYEAMKRDIDISLANLQTDVIDLYQLHNPKATDDISGPYRALKEAASAGKIRHIGITNHSAPFLLQVIKKYEFDTIQFPYNFLEAQGEEVFRVAHEAGLGTIAMKPLAGGVIERGRLAIKFIQNNPNITIAIPGMASVEEVLDNSNIENLTYSSEELVYMQELKAATTQEFCHRCGYCLPCTKGIEIPVMFTFEGYFNRYDLKNWARERYQSMAV
jgi:aryl-alcohol dehydrogenase-like predicted oxidoreductase